MKPYPTSAPRSRRGAGAPPSPIVFGAEVGDDVLPGHPAQRVLELHQLDEEVVLRIELRGGHRALEVKAQPLLRAVEACALREIEEQREVEDHRRREDRVAAQEVDLDLHRVAEPP